MTSMIVREQKVVTAVLFLDRPPAGGPMGRVVEWIYDVTASLRSQCTPTRPTELYAWFEAGWEILPTCPILAIPDTYKAAIGVRRVVQLEDKRVEI